MKFGSPSARQSLACAGRSHVGLVRDENEDSFGLATDRGIVVVADGMGGHDNGRYVADCAVEALCQVTPGATLEETLGRAREALSRTSQDVWRRSQECRRTMGATLVAAVIDDDRIGVIWAGDSRAYVFRDRSLIPLTRDHSAVQDLLDNGSISPLEAAEHPMRHVVTRAVGVTPPARRTNSGSRQVARSLASAWLTVGCEMPRRTAARLTLPSAWIARNTLSRLRSAPWIFID